MVSVSVSVTLLWEKNFWPKTKPPTKLILFTGWGWLHGSQNLLNVLLLPPTGVIWSVHTVSVPQLMMLGGDCDWDWDWGWGVSFFTIALFLH